MSLKPTDIAFPVTFDESGEARLCDVDEDIRQSLHLLLSTRRGERLMRPEYGCDLAQFAFESVNYSLISRITNEISQAIAAFEPRVEQVELSADGSGESSGALIINISYIVRENAHEQSLSFELGSKF